MSSPRYFAPSPFHQQTLTADLCIYGGVSGGVIAAVEAARRGLRVIVLEPSLHLGGLSAGGLGMTDVGNKHVIGGLSREFYRRVGAHYGVNEEWRFEPHVAEKIFNEWLTECGVRCLTGQFVQSVSKVEGRLVSLTTVSGLTVTADMFIDASYEGDLMALAGVSYTVGRESNAHYNETLNGAQIHTEHQFTAPVDPYIIPGNPASGVLPGIDADSSFEPGKGDRRLQAYNFRMCLTDRPDIRVPFPKPSNYDPSWYVLLKRHLATGWNEAFRKFDPIRNGKTDTNNHGAVSTDFIGQNHDYPEANYAEREKIYQSHVTWQQGLMWCLANDPEVPAAIREPMSKWGLCRDEFTGSGGWPHALYVRESRRMVSDYVMTEHNCRGARVVDDPVGMAAYGMDSHNIRRIIVDGRVVNEGDVQAGGFLPYPISYRSITPKKTECENLLVAYCLSASHIGFGSIRMEPVLMVLGQSCAIAAALALAGKTSVQNVPYAALHRELQSAGQILSRPREIQAFKVGETEADPVATR